MADNMKLCYFTNDESFPFFIQYGCHDEEMFVHGHEDFSELVIVLDGSAVHVVKNERFEIKKGDVFVMNQGTVHGYEAAQNFRICNIMFRTETFISENYDIRQLSGFHALFLLEPKYNSENGFKSRLRLTPAAFSDIEVLVNNLHEEYLGSGGGRKTMVRSLFLQLAVRLSRLYGTNVRHKEIEGISKAAAYMESNYMDDINMNELLNVSHYSQRHFIRLFSATYSTTPQQYLLGIKIRHATLLLREKTFSITEIATKCGFNDSNYFCRVFKKYTGMTPSAYRRTTIV
ncbi:MAG: AraC family transcriptional regulator [Ruminiclostridium sp.]|nr:AraC family transcriptional regulator [Ruminiclostridium sp.]